MESRMSVIMIHGFDFDPRSKKHSPEGPTGELFPAWRYHLTGVTTPVAHPWFSVPRTLGNIVGAWRSGYLDRYKWAFHLADVEGRGPLRSKIMEHAPTNILCHSLGSRVVLSALSSPATGSGSLFNADRLVGRVLLLNAAEHVPAARDAAEYHFGVEFFNVVVRTDDILRGLGGLMSPRIGYESCVGQVGMGDPPPNWHDLVLDDPDLQFGWGLEHGYDLRGDDPDGVGDHWYSYEWAPNWELYRNILSGADLELCRP